MDPKAYYETRTAALPDAPPYSTELDPLIPHLVRIEPGDTWQSFKQRMDSEQDQASRGTTLTTAIYPNDASENHKRFVLESNDQDAFDTLLSQHASSWPTQSKVANDVYRALAGLTSVWSGIPVMHDPNSADWIWSRARCIFGAAGYEEHAALARILTAQYAQCPLLPSETQAEWTDQLQSAHVNCGYPVHLPILPWRELAAVVRPVDESEPMELWHKVLGLLHILKHVRLRHDGDLAVTYNGVAAQLKLDTNSNVLGQQRSCKISLLTALGIPSAKGGKQAHPLARGVHWALNHLTANQLLVAGPITGLPGTVLTGPWATLVPNPNSLDGFIQHGCSLHGVWLANNGRVEVCYGDDDDVMDYAWNVTNSTSKQNTEQRSDLERILPATYQAQLPSELFFPAFPNIETGYAVDLVALKCLFDAPLIAGLIRSEIPALAYEIPHVAFLPSIPDTRVSTNQGKSYAAEAYARVLTPGIRKEKIAVSNSAPDSRAAADIVRRYGTACIDEWQLPKIKSHVFSREAMQVLADGAAVSSGRAMENTDGTIQLKQSMVLASKALDYPADLVNRTLTWYMENLTDEHLADGGRFNRVRNGALSLEMRLSALAFIENYGVVDDIARLAPTATRTVTGFRYVVIRLIARLLYEIRTGRPETGQIDRATKDMDNRYEKHDQDADDQGVYTNQNTGTNLRLRMSAVFADLTTTNVNVLKNTMEQGGHAVGNSKQPWASVSGLIEARLNIAGMPTNDYSGLVRLITGDRTNAGNRAVLQELMGDIKRVLPNGSQWPLPGTLGVAGWILHRMDGAGMINLRLEQHVNPATSAESLVLP